MPLSTIAIAGACGAGPTTNPVNGSVDCQSDPRSVEAGHIDELGVAATGVEVAVANGAGRSCPTTAASGVIANTCGDRVIVAGCPIGGQGTPFPGDWLHNRGATYMRTDECRLVEDWIAGCEDRPEVSTQAQREMLWQTRVFEIHGVHRGLQVTGTLRSAGSVGEHHVQRVSPGVSVEHRPVVARQDVGECAQHPFGEARQLLIGELREAPDVGEQHRSHDALRC